MGSDGLFSSDSFICQCQCQFYLNNGKFSRLACRSIVPLLKAALGCSYISFSLLDSEHQQTFSLNLPARLITIADTERPYCYKFAMVLEKAAERQLSKFIFQRQVEIIREIKDGVLAP